MDLSAVPGITMAQKAMLKKANIRSASDILLLSNTELMKKCKMTPADVDTIKDLVCKAFRRPAPLLEEVISYGQEAFTTGDSGLDRILGGGIRTGMLWEIAGESAAGKTQIALQLSLFVQLPMELRGLCGSACYLTTSSKLKTSRLVQIRDSHPGLSSTHCSLSDIHTLTTPTLPVLTHALSMTFPTLLKQMSTKGGQKPVKLLIIDALTELFHSDKQTTTNTLVERSKHIAQISALLHTLASEHQIAVLVLNEVVDAIEQQISPSPMDGNDLIYKDQARWFSRADSIPGENRKEAGLGLVWANQVNTRIMCTRTNRHRNLYNYSDKRAKTSTYGSVHETSSPGTDSATRIRRLTVIFSSVSAPASVDYIVTVAGMATVDDIGSALPSPTTRKRPISAVNESVAAERSSPTPGLTSQDLPVELDEPDGATDQWADSDELYPELDFALLDAADAEV